MGNDESHTPSEPELKPKKDKQKTSRKNSPVIDQQPPESKSAEPQKDPPDKSSAKDPKRKAAQSPSNHVANPVSSVVPSTSPRPVSRQSQQDATPHPAVSPSPQIHQPQPQHPDVQTPKVSENKDQPNQSSPQSSQPNQSQQAQVPFYKATFVWKERTEGDVFVSGSFNRWKNKIRLAPITVDVPSESGEAKPSVVRHELVLNLKPGQYYYKYIVNGKWMHDPSSRFAKDTNGNMVNVMEVLPTSPSPKQPDNTEDTDTKESSAPKTSKDPRTSPSPTPTALDSTTATKKQPLPRYSFPPNYGQQPPPQSLFVQSGPPFNLPAQLSLDPVIASSVAEANTLISTNGNTFLLHMQMLCDSNNQRLRAPDHVMLNHILFSESQRAFDVSWTKREKKDETDKENEGLESLYAHVVQRLFRTTQLQSVAVRFHQKSTSILFYAPTTRREDTRGRSLAERGTELMNHFYDRKKQAAKKQREKEIEEAQRIAQEQTV
ncbi:putative Glycogen recognition site of AMP-activated protein kinase [Blattamonas nauphoetae]|uniref:Glycogen recognition site of AMP-activated protein kinase n=1 Tax=Blattamonas nauphoetae TaxID=2049346 RepID=A0ABQ9YA62_9EUKA|nr:putative Glycogen recognition site of AMP-activated protein kinase [Blattamonas nauphoetae]